MSDKFSVKINRLAKRYKAIQILGGECEHCGEKNMFSLEFHHKNTSEKEYTLNCLIDYRWSLIEKEIKKCSLLCRNCHANFHYNLNSSTYYTNNKKIFLEYKGVNGCEECGYDECNASLDFHHIDKKSFNIGGITSKFVNFEELSEIVENELNKCVVLCKNCHSKEQNDMDFFIENKEKIIKKSNNLKELHSKIDRLKVKELYNIGMSQKDISKYFNVSKSTISTIFKELDIRKPKIDKEVEELYDNGVIQSEIARKLNVSRSTIGNIVRRLKSNSL